VPRLGILPVVVGTDAFYLGLDIDRPLTTVMLAHRPSPEDIGIGFIVNLVGGYHG
jgi:hypothetical protein